MINPSSPSDLLSPLVLLVDDEVDARESMAEYLELAGFRVVSAGTAAEALAATELEVPAVAVIDLGLPDSTGEELGHALKREPRTAHVPLIVVSGRRVHDEDGMKAGIFAAVLRKPVHPALIVQEIRRYLTPRAAPGTP
jgi:CheY-like chemotaxis protein